MRELTNNLTRGNIYEKILTFALPAILANIFIHLYNYLDAVIVGRFIGKEALASVGVASPYIYILSALVSGFTIGGGIIISRLFVANKSAQIRRFSNTLYIITAVLALVVTALLMWTNPYLVSIMGLSEEISYHATQYLNIYSLGVVPIFLFSAMTALLRGVGNTKLPLYFLIASSILNFALNLIFVALLGKGVEWVAAGSVISQAVALVAQGVYVGRVLPEILINPFSSQFNFKYAKEILRLGIPTSVQQLFVALGSLILVVIVSKFGTDVIAAYTSAHKLLIVIMVIFTQLSLSLTTVTAQNYAAGQHLRVISALKATIVIQLVASFAILLLISMFSTYFMSSFSNDINIINIGKQYLMIIGVTMWLFSIMSTYTGLLRGLGDTFTPMIITIISLWAIKIPVAYLLSSYINEVGVWFSEPISWCVASMSLIVYYNVRTKKLLINK